MTRYFEQVWNKGRLDQVEEFVAEDFDEDNMRQIYMNAKKTGLQLRLLHLRPDWD